jgi:hypothetical protein
MEEFIGFLENSGYRVVIMEFQPRVGPEKNSPG